MDTAPIFQVIAETALVDVHVSYVVSRYADEAHSCFDFDQGMRTVALEFLHYSIDCCVESLDTRRFDHIVVRPNLKSAQRSCFVGSVVDYLAAIVSGTKFAGDVEAVDVGHVCLENINIVMTIEVNRFQQIQSAGIAVTRELGASAPTVFFKHGQRLESLHMITVEHRN